MDGWNTSFLLGRPILRGYVSFREGISSVSPIPSNDTKKGVKNQPPGALLRQCLCFFCAGSYAKAREIPGTPQSVVNVRGMGKRLNDVECVFRRNISNNPLRRTWAEVRSCINLYQPTVLDRNGNGSLCFRFKMREVSDAASAVRRGLCMCVCSIKLEIVESTGGANNNQQFPMGSKSKTKIIFGNVERLCANLWSLKTVEIFGWSFVEIFRDDLMKTLDSTSRCKSKIFRWLVICSMMSRSHGVQATEQC